MIAFKPGDKIRYVGTNYAWFDKNEIAIVKQFKRDNIIITYSRKYGLDGGFRKEEFELLVEKGTLREFLDAGINPPYTVKDELGALIEVTSYNRKKKEFTVYSTLLEISFEIRGTDQFTLLKGEE